MSQSLASLLRNLGVDDVGVPADLMVRGATVDSRRAGPGMVFVAARGATASSRDGHDFAAAAVEAGAVAIVAERALPAVSVPVVQVADARHVGALLAEHLAGAPSHRLTLCGVTGTNGKTTVTSILAQLAIHSGRRGGVVGTLGIGDPFAPKSTGFTTPEAEDLSAALNTLLDDGGDIVGIEVSSHALATRRADGVRLAAVAFTNLSQDHLDFHGDFDAYFAAKARLFTDLVDDTTVAIIPAQDDDHAPTLTKGSVTHQLRACSPKAWTWGVDGDGEIDATVRAADVSSQLDGLHFTLHFRGQNVSVHAPGLVGGYNVDNAVVAAALALAAGLSLSAIAEGFRHVGPPPGRMERVFPPKGASAAAPAVFVDYAHTPDALERSLLCARQLTNGRLIAVVGCGGDRDRQKRPIMGRIATDVADVAIFTDDNPRSEASADILAAMVTDLKADAEAATNDDLLKPGSWQRIANRRLAIRAAIRAAGPDDVVVIAGKGHETTQRQGERVLPFDDVREARAALHNATRPAFLDEAVVAKALGVALSTPALRPENAFLGVSTDSRALEPGALFVALRGERFDGHGFLEAAFVNGAGAAIVDTAFAKSLGPDARRLPLYIVDDTLVALQRLAHHWLLAQPATRIALTGSNGKTTTKELIAAALRGAVADDEVLATDGNLNNHIGVPLTMLRVEAHHRFAILEMGMNHLGEIKSYCAFAPPQVGLVTNMGTAHAGNVGGLEGVAQAKAELFAALPNDGIAIVNADDPRCVREAQNKARCRHILFGRAPFADVRLVDVADLEDGGQRLAITWRGETQEVALPLDGRHNALNACGAVAVAVAVDVPFAKAVAGLGAVRPASGRLERRRRPDGLLVLDDSYNANPDSMEAGLNTLRDAGALAKRPTVAVLGDMLELGPQARAAHRHIGAAAAQAGIRRLFCCGAYAADYQEGAQGQGLVDVVIAPDSLSLAPFVLEGVAADDVVLVKGSRGARMERVAEALLLSGIVASTSAANAADGSGRGDSALGGTSSSDAAAKDPQEGPG